MENSDDSQVYINTLRFLRERFARGFYEKYKFLTSLDIIQLHSDDENIINLEIAYSCTRLIVVHLPKYVLESQGYQILDQLADEIRTIYQWIGQGFVAHTHRMMPAQPKSVSIDIDLNMEGKR